MDGNKNILFLRIVIVVYYFHFKMSTHNRARIFDYEPTSFKVGSIKMVFSICLQSYEDRRTCPKIK